MRLPRFLVVIVGVLAAGIPAAAGPDEAPPAEVLSGAALNARLREAQDLQGKATAVSDADLPDKVLERIRVRPRDGVAGIGLLRQAGRLDWPEALKGAAYKAERERVASLLPVAVEQAKQGKVPTEAVRQMSRDVQTLRRRLQDGINELSPSEYIRAARFLNQVDDALKLLQRPDAAEVLRAGDRAVVRARTVAGLVKIMTEQQLEFAPAETGDEEAYAALEKALSAYVRGEKPPEK